MRPSREGNVGCQSRKKIERERENINPLCRAVTQYRADNWIIPIARKVWDFRGRRNGEEKKGGRFSREQFHLFHQLRRNVINNMLVGVINNLWNIGGVFMPWILIGLEELRGTIGGLLISLLDDECYWWTYIIS